MPICPSCQTQNNPNDRFCQGCGQQLDQDPNDVNLIDTGIVCPGCDAFNEPNQKECIRCGQFLGGLTEILAAMSGQVQNVTPAVPKLILARGQADAHSAFALDDFPFSIGRQNTTISIRHDPYLSPLHAVIERNGDTLLVKDPGSLNGTFLRIRNPTELEPQTEIILGSQRILLVGAGGATFDSRTKANPNARIYGSPVPKQSFLALRELYSDNHGKAMAGSMILRAGPVITLGRHQCHLNYPADSLLADCHLELHIQGAKIKAIIPNENAEVFYRIKKPTPLRDRDEVLVGQELLRLEAS